MFVHLSDIFNPYTHNGEQKFNCGGKFKKGTKATLMHSDFHFIKEEFRQEYLDLVGTEKTLEEWASDGAINEPEWHEYPFGLASSYYNSLKNVNVLCFQFLIDE